jgi:hypothetical protein
MQISCRPFSHPLRLRWLASPVAVAQGIVTGSIKGTVQEPSSALGQGALVIAVEERSGLRLHRRFTVSRFRGRVTPRWWLQRRVDGSGVCRSLRARGNSKREELEFVTRRCHGRTKRSSTGFPRRFSTSGRVGRRELDDHMCVVSQVYDATTL